MSTTLANARIALSKELADYFASSTTSAGAANGTTLVDTALKAKANSWITDTAYDIITEAGHAALNEERKISSLANSTGTLTVLAHSVQIDTGSQAIDYEVHRLWSPSEKRIALIEAAKLAFPYIYQPIRDESRTAGNWLRNGDMEEWAVSTVPDTWARGGTITAAQEQTAKMYTRGASSCKLTASTNGYLYQSWTENDDLKYLRNKTVTLRVRGWCDTASALRLAINDGTTTTYSSYHAGNSAWNDDTIDSWYVQAQIDESATNVEFRIYVDSASAVVRVDDARVTGPAFSKVYVGDLGIHLNRPHVVSYQYRGHEHREPWQILRNYKLDTVNNCIFLHDVPIGAYLRIEGYGYLDFLASGASSTAWTATIAIDDPQLKILTAQAAMWLYEQGTMPQMDAVNRDEFYKALGYRKQKLQEMQDRFAMPALPIIVSWGN